jgi:hypothetical protein
MNGAGDAKDAGLNPESGSRLTGAAAFKTHLTLLLGLALCAGAFWFEIGRAERGNALSWAYVFEWPLLGLFAIYMWWKILHPGVSSKRRRRPRQAIAPEYEGMLAAWQDHQRELEATRRADEREISRLRGNLDGPSRNPE